ncbi:TPA: hypothetical protein SMQ16_002297 [Proteus mirabilis]|nr:hypothetical protein [Proteus mirabilis]EKU7617250.1 hypothetical protein [Proteus mirabilis]ELI0195804.1 hypothetical protein [Proteus mirabilis]ELT7778630.1 hypothetical protein [Proteus mirabilis]MBG2831341.1 hypothetical protein [Proteus mirabilis]
MPDIADDANDLTALQINTALANREPPAKSLTGFCIWCREKPVTENSAYCSKECGDDHAQYKRKNG